jgi:hypothetical protein
MHRIERGYADAMTAKARAFRPHVERFVRTTAIGQVEPARRRAGPALNERRMLGGMRARLSH